MYSKLFLFLQPLWEVWQNVTGRSYKEAAADNTQVYYEIKGYFYHGYNYKVLT